MAWVRMKLHVTGGRGDGSVWPPAGGLLECGDGEAADLVRADLAVLADEPPAAPAAAAEEPAPEPEAAVEVPAAAEEEDPASPAVRAEKARWVEHAIARGVDANIAGAMTKADLIARFGVSN